MIDRMKYIVAWKAGLEMKFEEANDIELAKTIAHALATVNPNVKVHIARIEQTFIMDTVRVIDYNADPGAAI